MGTPEARLGGLIEPMMIIRPREPTPESTDFEWSNHEKPWHEWTASQQQIVRNLVPVGTVLKNLDIPGPESDMIQRASELVAKEQSYILDTCEEATNKLYSSISSVVEKDAFKLWLQGHFSSTAIILGAGGETSCPISYMCATLGRKLCAKLDRRLRAKQDKKLPEMPYILPLSFFCQLHLEKHDPLRGVEGMMRSLIAQLLVHKSENRYMTNKLTIEQWAPGQIPLGNVGKLFQHFASLVKTVTAGTIICIIDGINHFTNSTGTGESDDANCVMRGFRELMKEVEQAREDKGGKVRLKLLLTIHEPGTHIEYQFTEATAILRLPGPEKRRAEELAEARAGKRRA